jgi:hypothetical protein
LRKNAKYVDVKNVCNRFSLVRVQSTPNSDLGEGVVDARVSETTQTISENRIAFEDVKAYGSGDAKAKAVIEARVCVCVRVCVRVCACVCVCVY